MSEHVERTLEMVVGQIADLQRQLSEKKKIANGLCQLAGHPPMFEDEEAVTTGTALRPDEFYGRPLATVVQEVLERRRRSGLGAATVRRFLKPCLAVASTSTPRTQKMRSAVFTIHSRKIRSFTVFPTTRMG